MIAKLSGRVDYVADDWIILMVGGVGYRVSVPLPTLATLTVDTEVSLYTYTHVREDAILLYGFRERKEQELFELLVSVSGVGPRLAMALLSYLSIDRIVSAIVQRETKALMQVSGVGKKTAERLILELKDKLAAWSAFQGEGAGVHAVSTEAGSTAGDVISALVGLGYTEDAAVSAVQAVLVESPEASVEDALRLALKKLQPV